MLASRLRPQAVAVPAARPQLPLIITHSIRGSPALKHYLSRPLTSCSSPHRRYRLTFFELRKPGPLFRASIIVAQGVFWNLYFIG